MNRDTKSQKKRTYKNVFIAGINEKRFDIEISNGRFASIARPANEQVRPNKDLWISPGLIDLHTHLGWTDFDQADQLKRDRQEVDVLQARAFEATLKAGFTTVRDAGGLMPGTAQYIKQHYKQPLSVDAAGYMFGAKDAKGPAYLERRVNEIIDKGARWIKVLATGGLGSRADEVLDPFFSKEEFFAIVRSAHARKTKVMVHTWGGPTMDWSIDARVDSVEHGIYMTEAQAARLAQSETAFVPTATIYRIAADSPGPLSLGSEIRERAARAADAHPKAIHYAKEAGVRLGLGTDFSTPALHGRNLEELDTLIDCGLTRQETWQTATESAAEILGYGDTLGQVKEGFIADAVLFNADPCKTQNADALRKSIVAVIKQ